MHFTSVSPSWRPRIESTADGPASPPQGLAPGLPIELLWELKCPGRIDGRQAGHAALQTMHADGSSVIQTVMPTSRAPEEDKLAFLALLISKDVRDLLVVREGAPWGRSGTGVDDSLLAQVRDNREGLQWSFRTDDRQLASVRAQVWAGEGRQAPELQVNWVIPGRYPFDDRIRLHQVDLIGSPAEMRHALEPFFQGCESRARAAEERPEERPEDQPLSVVVADAPGMSGSGAALMLMNEWLARRAIVRRGEARIRPPRPSAVQAHPGLRPARPGAPALTAAR